MLKDKRKKTLWKGKPQPSETANTFNWNENVSVQIEANIPKVQSNRM